MTNYSTDPNEIRKAAQSGLIDQSDYQSYLEIESDLQILKKGLFENELSADVYAAAVDCSDKFEFVKTNEGGQIRFKLNIIRGSVTPAKIDTIRKSLDTRGMPTNAEHHAEQAALHMQSARDTIVKSNNDYSLPASVTRAINELSRMANDFITKRRNKN